MMKKELQFFYTTGNLVLFIATTSNLLQAAFLAIGHPMIAGLLEVLSLLTGKGLRILEPDQKFHLANE
jgi:hypothetical protein